jgi:hypothetical protein
LIENFRCSLLVESNVFVVDIGLVVLILFDPMAVVVLLLVDLMV